MCPPALMFLAALHRSNKYHSVTGILICTHSTINLCGLNLALVGVQVPHKL